MTKPTIYGLALEIAEREGWRNVTRGPLFQLCKERGLVGSSIEATWCKNSLRGPNSMTNIRRKLSAEPGITEGAPGSGGTSPAWKDANKQNVLDKAYALARTHGLMVSRAVIAEEAGVSAGTVSGIWGGMQNLRQAVIEKARMDGALGIVDQGRAMGLTK